MPGNSFCAPSRRSDRHVVRCARRRPLGTQKFLSTSMFLSALILPLIFVVHGDWLFLVLGILGLILISSFPVAIVMAQQLLPRHLGIASGLMVGFAIGTGGAWVTVLGVIADHFGVPCTEIDHGSAGYRIHPEHSHPLPGPKMTVYCFAKVNSLRTSAGSTFSYSASPCPEC